MSSGSLEFDHVVVLDGGWEERGRDRDSDEDRRLYYVAMTRARDTLGLMRFKARHSLQETLADNPAVLRRAAVELPAAPAGLGRRLQRLSLAGVDLAFAGRRGPQHTAHDAIARLSAGDSLQIRINESGRWELRDQARTVVGRLARRFEAPIGMRCVGAAVFAVVTRSRAMSEPQYLDSLKCETWEVMVPELLFELVQRSPNQGWIRHPLNLLSRHSKGERPVKGQCQRATSVEGPNA